MSVEQNIKDIAELEYSLWVVNTYAAGIQQKDGKYITKYFPMSPFVIENMLLENGSMGCYQQGYKTNQIKWICFDFDCKDKDDPDVYELYEKCILPFVQMLDNWKIKYLTEFSGRRGIHVWMIFNTIFSKELGFRIICELERQNPIFAEIRKNEKWGIDRFPATDSSRNNKVGKQVKFPLSCHQSGARSYLFKGQFEEKKDTSSAQFFEEQLDIMKDYQPNDINEVMEKLNLNNADLEMTKLKYKKYRLIGNIEITTDQVINILSETKVFAQIFERMQKGTSEHQDWTVILGTLCECDLNGTLVKDVFKRFPNYNANKTQKNIEKLRGKYFPATFGYLYRIYGIEMEDILDEDETGLHYLLCKCGLEQNILEEFEKLNEKKLLLDLNVTVQKEKNYLKENDEVADACIWNQLRNLKQYDLYFYNKLINSVIAGKYEEYEPSDFKVFKRIENEEKTRQLVSLSAKDRVITTNLALRLCDLIKKCWKSFSYRISYTSQEHIFYHWYSSWGRFIDQICVFMDIPFMSNYEVFYIDLKGFYDHIDFLAVYRRFENILTKEAKNIFCFLVEYNEQLMKKIKNGCRIGVPQGPAYARIIAELFLDQLVNYVKVENDGVYVYRYVDDIVVFCRPDVEGKAIFDKMMQFFPYVGLPINLEKSKYFGKVSNLTCEEKKILSHKDNFNYELSENDYTGILLERERRKKLQKYLMENSFNIGSLGYIFGKNTITEAKLWCLNNFRRDILKSCEGRGSNYRKFYEFLFQNSQYMEEILDNEELTSIPRRSLNFSNFVHTLYYAVQDQSISSEIFERIKSEYLKKISAPTLNEDDQIIVEALILVNAEVQDEKA